MHSSPTSVPKSSAFDRAILLAHVLGCSYKDLWERPEPQLVQEQKEHFNRLCERCEAGEPIAYIVGSTQFWDLELLCSPAALIPRPETEELCYKLLQRLPSDCASLWDICTGTGAIAITMKKKCQDLTVYASDICPNALALAQKNAQKCGTGIIFSQGDLFNALHAVVDCIVINPPYLAEHEYGPALSHEPKKALVSGTTGFEFYERILATLPPCRFLALEIGFSQGDFFRNRPLLGAVAQVEKDMSGHERFVFYDFWR